MQKNALNEDLRAIMYEIVSFAVIVIASFLMTVSANLWVWAALKEHIKFGNVSDKTMKKYFMEVY